MPDDDSAHEQRGSATHETCAIAVARGCTNGRRKKKKERKKKKKRKEKPIGGAANVQPTPTASPQPTLRIPFFLNDSGSRVMHSYFHVFSFPCISIHARVRLCKPSSTTHVTMHRIIHVLVRELLLLHCSFLRVKHEVI